MKSIVAPAFLSLLFALAPAAGLAQKASAREYSVEEFFRRAQFTDMQLSPGGGKLAAGVPFQGRTNLLVIDLAKRTRVLVTSFKAVDAVSYYWVNDERLCMLLADGQAVTGEYNYRGSFCVDVDGKNLRDFSQHGFRTPLARYYDGSANLIVPMRTRSRDSVDLYKLDANTGATELLTFDSPGDVQRWVLDRNLVARIAVSSPEREGRGRLKSIVWYRDSAEAKWERLFEHETLGGQPLAGGVSPIAFDYDGATLYVSTNVGRDKRAIYRYDTKARKLGEVLFEDPLVDVSGGLVFDRVRRKLLGIQYDAAMPKDIWIDAELARVQKGIDAALPGKRNLISLPANSSRHMLVYSYSDVDPGSYLLYDTERNGIEPLVRTREWLDPALMAERRFITYKARDGRDIPAYVTMPKGTTGKNLPLIVNVHGGPWVRGYRWAAWGRWPVAQFLASRGYVVLEPEPRGSTGFGHDHFRASFKQWGLAMQDDLNDGALHLAKEGIVDRSRMCIHGGSYGGYAAAMGAARDSGLWKCASPYVAVTDLFLFQSVAYSDISMFTDFFEHDFKMMVGDSRADRELFMKTSPVQLAAGVKIPVLLTMGGNDRRVPQVHGDEFYKAVDRAGGKVDYKVYPGEGHGFNKDENVIDFYTRLEKFYAEHLK